MAIPTTPNIRFYRGLLIRALKLMTNALFHSICGQIYRPQIEIGMFTLNEAVLEAVFESITLEISHVSASKSNTFIIDDAYIIVIIH